MNGVIGITELLLDTELSPTQLEYVRMVRSSGENLLTVINDILDMSKIEAGKLHLERTDLNMADVVEEVCLLLANTARAKGLTFDLVLDPDLDRAAIGDPVRIRQVLTNLIGNAIKFTDTERIEVQASATDGGARFEVTDTGVGVDPARHQALWDDFSQADTTTTRRYGGTGLGLAISKSLVEAMGGEIGMESTLGEGSSFWFTVALGDDRTARPSTQSSLKDVCALVVPGDEPGHSTVDRLLESWGVDLRTVRAGEVSEAIRAHRAPQVVIVEEGPACKAPLRVVEEVRGASAGVPVLVLAEQRIESPLLRGDSTALLVKPIRRSRLYNVMSALVAGQEQPASPVGTNGARESSGIDANGARLLLAEDDEVNQTVAAAMLQKCGYRVEIAENGRRALEMLEGDTYEAVLMDCQMPELDGYEATREIRRAGWQIPIIAMTAHSMIADRDKCIAAGMDDYISKPVRLEQLADVLARWVPEGAEHVSS